MVKQGYKQTEIGVIPEDWDVRTLEALYNITSSKRVFQSQWRKGGIPFYRAREIAVMSEGKPAPEDLYIDVILYDLYTRQYGSIKKDDVLITGVGTLGKVYVVKENDQFYFKDGNIIWLQFKGGFSSQYLKHQYDMPVLINQVFGNAGGSTVATYTITNAKATKVPIPPLEEQKRIAEALSDVDSMISSLEKLIAKKKAVKQGVTQELLTGKKRLSGFTGEWTVKYIDDIATIMDNCRIPVKESDREKMAGTIPYCGANGIVGYINGYTIDDEIILIAEDGGYFDEYATRPIAYKMSGKCWVNNHAHILKSKSNTDQNYLFYCLVHKDIRDFISSGTRSKLNKAELLKITIKLPLCLEEQIAIASILSDMDNEIEALAQKLEKTRQLKQGMMQQLLTGKIRLV